MLSRIDGNDAAEAKNKSQLKVPSAGDYTACSRSTCALHAFTGSEARPYRTFNISLPRSSMEANIIQYVYSLVGDRSFWAFGPVQAYFVEIYRFWCSARGQSIKESNRGLLYQASYTLSLIHI